MKKYILVLFTFLCLGFSFAVNAEEFIGNRIYVSSLRSPQSAMFHLTALLETDEDVVEGSVVKVTLKGKNALNMKNSTASGANITSDNSGEVSNSKYVEAISPNTLAHSQVVNGSDIEIIMQDRTLSKTPSTPYIKVPIMLYGTAPFSFDISELSITINGKEKEILKLGSFFSEEKISILSTNNGSSEGENSFTIYSDSKITIDEEFIYNTFKSEYSDFSLEEFPYIKCSYRYSNSQNVSCIAITEELLNNLFLHSHQSSYGYYEFKNNDVTTSSISFSYNIYDSSFSINSSINKLFPYNSNSVISYSLYYNNSHYKDYTNYNPSLLPNVSSNYNSNINKLDFSRYETTLKFDENLFDNDDNFKKVCVNSNSSFSITKNHDDGVMSGSDHDYIWFPHGISGIKKINFSTEKSDGYYEFDNPYENYYFSNYENINSIWNSENVGSNFEAKGYTDKYKYYGYTAYLFLHWYNFSEGQTYNFFPIFELTENVTTSHISSSGAIHGGGGLRLDDDEEIEFSNEYCFYIKNEYEINEVILDEWGDHYVSVNTPIGPMNYGTSINKDNANSESFLSQPIKFISEMSGTITFLNANIYNLYMSMPLIVRTFLITALIILIVMLIMKLGGYK